MARMDAFKEEILSLKAAGISVREISRKLEESTGESFPHSTVQYAIKQWSNGNGQSKTNFENHASVLERSADSPEVLAQQRPTIKERLIAWRARMPEVSKGKKVLALAMTAIIVGVVAGSFSRSPAKKANIVEQIKPEAKNVGIQVEIFHTPEYWMAVKWPVGTASPLTRIDGGYRLNIVGLVEKFAVDQSTELTITDVSEINDKIKPLCYANTETLECGYLYEFLSNADTWDKLVMAKKEPLTR